MELNPVGSVILITKFIYTYTIMPVNRWNYSSQHLVALFIRGKKVVV